VKLDRERWNLSDEQLALCLQLLDEVRAIRLLAEANRLRTHAPYAMAALYPDSPDWPQPVPRKRLGDISRAQVESAISVRRLLHELFIAITLEALWDQNANMSREQIVSAAVEQGLIWKRP